MIAERRITPSKESLSHMKRLRDNLPAIQKKIPEVQGLGFFGSRTQGREKPNSDLDLVVFFDISSLREQVEHALHNGIDNSEIQSLIEKREMLKRNIVTSYARQLDDLSLPQDMDPVTQRNNSIKLVEISKISTDSEILGFIKDVKRTILEGKSPYRDTISEASWALTSRFFLGVGDGLSKNRGYILDVFEHMGIYGEAYFKILMEYLQVRERTLPTKKRGALPAGYLPSSIGEARRYFRTK